MKSLIVILAWAICINFTSEVYAQSNLNYVDHLIFSATENSLVDQSEAINVSKSPFSSHYFSRFSAQFHSNVDLDLSLGTTPENHSFIPLCSSCIQTLFRFHESNSLQESFSVLVKKSSPPINNSVSDKGFQYGPNGYMIDLILDTASVAHAGNEMLQNKSSVYRTSELMLFDYNQSMFYKRLTKFKDEINYVQTVRINRAKYNTLIGTDTYCLDFSFRDTLIVSSNLEIDTLVASERSTYLHVVNNELQAHKGIIGYDGTFIHQISVVVDDSVYRVYELSGTANLEPRGVFTYSTPQNHRELMLVKYEPEGNVIWVKTIAADDAGSMINPGSYVVKMVPNDDYLALGYNF